MMQADLSHLLVVLVAVIVATKLLGEIAQRLGQPSVLGELVAGVILGRSLFGVLAPGDPVIHALSEMGVIVLLFEIGLHTDLRSLLRVGRVATTVALVGVAVPFLLGYEACRLLGLDSIAAIVCGASLTATSIGISARVLSDLGQLPTAEGQVVLGAAVIDDVVGLIILSVVSALASGVAVSAVGVGVSTAVAIGFVVAAIVVGSKLAPPLLRIVSHLQTSGVLGLVALAFAFLMAWAAGASRSAPIVGAFAAGLVLHDTPQREEVERSVTTLGHFFVPIFFAAVGAAVDIRALAAPGVVAAGAVLVGVGIAGKFVAGYAPWWFRGNKKLIGVSMIPRGEVGLIFAQMGLATGALDVSLFSAVTVMVMITTLVSPPLLSVVTAPSPAAPRAEGPGCGSIGDLVAGASEEASD